MKLIELLLTLDSGTIITDDTGEYTAETLIDAIRDAESDGNADDHDYRITTTGIARVREDDTVDIDSYKIAEPAEAIISEIKLVPVGESGIHGSESTLELNLPMSAAVVIARDRLLRLRWNRFDHVNAYVNGKLVCQVWRDSIWEGDDVDNH